MAKKTTVKNYKTSDINPAEYNPRSITQGALDGLVKSIEKFGNVQPLIVNIRGGKNVLVGGHQRLKALEILGIKEAPVVEVDLDPIEEKALNVALNNPSIQGEFTQSVKDILAEIELNMPEDFFALKLNNVPVPVIKDDWESDLEDVKKVDEDDSPVPALIKITCNQSDKEELLESLKEFLDSEGFADVTVE
ncbi:hypothetical protein MASR1M48_16760 [Lactococcus petauri]